MDRASRVVQNCRRLFQRIRRSVTRIIRETSIEMHELTPRRDQKSRPTISLPITSGENNGIYENENVSLRAQCHSEVSIPEDGGSSGSVRFNPNSIDLYEEALDYERYYSDVCDSSEWDTYEDSEMRYSDSESHGTLSFEEKRVKIERRLNFSKK